MVTSVEQPEQWAVDIAASLGLYSDVSVRTIVRAFANRHGDLVAAKLAFAEREAELVGAIKWAGEVAPPVDHNGCVTVDMTLEQLNAMRTLAGFRALKSREAGHG